MGMLEKYDPVIDQQYRGQAEGEDLGSGLTGLLGARYRVLMRMIRAARTAALDCCCEAKGQIADLDFGDVAILGITDETLELNSAGPSILKFDDHQHTGDGFTISTAPGQLGRVTVTKDGWYRIYALSTYESVTADTSIKILAYANGIILPGRGRHGHIANAGGHTSSSSSLETWAQMNANDYIDISTQQNGAAGAVNPIAGESLLVVERKPYPMASGGGV